MKKCWYTVGGGSLLFFYPILYPISVYHTPSSNRGLALYYLQLSKFLQYT